MKKNKKNQGFTLIEMLVAMSILAIVILTTVNIFLVGMSGARRTGNQQVVQDNIRFISEMMAKEIRMSTIDSSCSPSCETLNITNGEGQSVQYVFNSGDHSLTRIVGGVSSKLNSDKVNINKFAFYVLQIGSSPARVTIVMGAASNQGSAAQQVEIDTQTTVASRQFSG